MNDRTLSVSVVIPVLNGARTLPVCLAALEQLDPAPVEIIVVDNGSTDGSLQILETWAARHPHWVHIRQEKKRGAAAARNTGAKAAKGDVLAFTDSDCVPEREWLKTLPSCFSIPHVGAVAGHITGRRGTTVLELFSTLYTFQVSEESHLYTCITPGSGGFPTANFSVRHQLFQQLHGFDESAALSGEDYDLCARIYGAGFQILYEPTVDVVHYHRVSVHALLRQAFGFGRGHAYILAKHFRCGLWVDLPRRSFAWGKFPVAGWISLASADKKLAAIVVLSAASLLLLPVSFAYCGWLVWLVSRRAHRAQIQLSLWEMVELAGLLVMKSAAMTAGRWLGSIRYRTLCL